MNHHIVPINGLGTINVVSANPNPRTRFRIDIPTFNGYSIEGLREIAAKLVEIADTYDPPKRATRKAKPKPEAEDE